MPGIRPKAVCVFRRGAEILVGPAFDSVKEEEFFNPPGGGIEFGEYSDAAIRREIEEELSAEVTGLDLLGIRETVFSFEGGTGHEIVFVYSADFVDRSFYEKTEIDAVESSGRPFVVRWMELETFGPGGPPLYPEGLFELLRQGA